jgi:hypothetical protein
LLGLGIWGAIRTPRLIERVKQGHRLPHLTGARPTLIFRY